MTTLTQRSVAGRSLHVTYCIARQATAVCAVDDSALNTVVASPCAKRVCFAGW